MTTKTKATIHAPSELVKLYLNRQAAEQRLQLAQQTLAGATQQFVDADSRLRGVGEYLYGVEAMLEMVNGRLLVHPHGNPAGNPSNGAAPTLEMTLPQLNRAARRAAKLRK